MTTRRAFRWPSLLTESGRGIAFGGDYNPDQWPEETLDEDIRLMGEAGVNVVSLAIFSWDKIEPVEGAFTFEWLDHVIDRLGKAGIAVDLASATATAPLWLYESHPEVLPVDRYGHIVNAGSRQSWQPTSPVFKEYALRLCRKLAEHYEDNQYVTAWHMGNEYGWNNRYDYSNNALAAFRTWCEAKYGTIDALNEAWGTAFWSQHVNSFDEVLLPRHMGGDAMVNPPQQLDYERFGNDMLLDFYKAERDAIEQICPGKPFTTNFMVSTDQCVMDYAKWAGEVDFVSNDHYFHEGESHLDELACSDALMDSLALGKPWYVMEHSTSAVQWKPLNTRKRAGTAILFSAESEWAARSETLPSMKLNHWHDVRDWYRGFLDAGLRADVVPLAYDWADYKTIVLPTVLSLSDEDVRRIADFAKAGGIVIVGYATGLIDEYFHIGLGGYPGAGNGLLRDMLGIRSEEFNILGEEAEGEPSEISLSNGLTTRLWQNDVTSIAADTTVLASYAGESAADWELERTPAITSRPYGNGTAIYVGCDLNRHDIAQLLKALGSRWRELSAQPTEGGQTPTYPTTDPRILHTIRRSADGSTRFDFYLNRSNQPVAINGVEGDPIIVHRCETDAVGYTLNRNAILIAKTSC